MRTFIPALALLFMLSIAHAVSLSVFLKPYMLPGESFRAENFDVSNRSFSLIKIFGQPSFLVEARQENFSLIDDQQEIYGILWERAVSEIDAEGTKNASLLQLHEFNRTRQPNEDECKRLTGTDRLPCEDKDSCIVACRSVPVCETALSYSLDSILALKDWLDTTKRLDLQLQVAIAAHSIVGDNYDPAYVQDALAEEEHLKALALNITTNIIFHCGPGGSCYCPTPKFNLTSLDSSKKLLSSFRNQLAALLLIENTSEQLALKAADRSKIRDEGASYALVLAESQERISTVRNAVDGSLVLVSDPALKSQLNEAQALLLSLTDSVKKKDYVSAGSDANTLNQKLEAISELAEDNKAQYAEVMALHTNATASLAALDSLELSEPLLLERDSLHSRFDSVDVTLPVEKKLLKGIRSELAGVAKEADDIYVSVEGERLSSMLSKAEARFNNLTLLIENYRQQSVNLTNLSSSLRLADVLLDAGDVRGAEENIESANAQMDVLFPQLMKRTREIDLARKAMENASQALYGASTVRFNFVQPGLAEANSRLMQATDKIYSDPASAALLAEEAEAIANESVARAASQNQLILIVGVFLGLVLLLGLLYWLYKREEE